MSKQSKFYETLKQTQINMFNDGLNMDLHPLTTPNTILTDCVNGTMITYNDNEFVLQNTRGNTSTKSYLSKGFVPVAIKEYQNVLYIISYNPDSKETEIGSYPSPILLKDYSKNTFYEKENISIKNIANFSQIQSNIEYYDLNTKVSSQDKYELKILSEDPLFVLEHYILSESGNLNKIDLQKNQNLRFPNSYTGILGYKYRPLYLQKMDIKFFPVNNNHNSSLYIELSTEDKELLSKLDTNIYVECDVNFYLSNLIGKNEILFTSRNVQFNNWNEFYSSINILEISNLLSEDEIIDHKNNVIIKNDKEYDSIVIEIIPKIINKKLINSSTIIMDNLIQRYKYTVSDVIPKEDWFDQFTYSIVNDNGDNYEIVININLVYENFDPLWTKHKFYDVGDASFKLYLINENGQLEGQEIKVADSFHGYDRVEAEEVNGDVSADGETRISIKSSTMEQCQTLPKTENIKTLQFLVSNHEGGNNYWNVGGAQDFRVFTCDEVEENATSTCAHYIINNLQVKKNVVYLLELIFPINDVINHASFIMITSEEMLKNKASRKDKLPLDSWFHPKINASVEFQENESITGNQSYNIRNIFSHELLETIKSSNNDDINKLGFEFFKQYDQLLDVNKMNDEIPSITVSKNLILNVSNNSMFSGIISNPIISGDGIEEKHLLENKNNINFVLPQYKKVSAILKDKSKTIEQKSERKYLYDLFNDKVHNIDLINERIFVITAYDPSGNNCAYHIKNFGRIARINWPEFKNNWAKDTTKIQTQYEPTAIMNGGCNKAKIGKNRSIDCLTSVETNESGSLQVMRSLGFINGIAYGKIKTCDYVRFAGQSSPTFRIWMIGMNNDLTKKYLNSYKIEDQELFISQWDAFIKHFYYLKSVDPIEVQQYSYDTEFIETEQIINNKELKINCSIKPSYGLAENHVTSALNVQSWNNLKGTISVDTTLYLESEFNVDMNNYKKFIEVLTGYINTFPIPEDFSEKPSDDLKSDLKDKLISEDGEIRIVNDQLEIPFKLNVSENELYDSVGFDTEDFEYEEDCLFSLKWSNKKEWPITWSRDDSESFKKYKHILFYKLTNYEA